MSATSGDKLATINPATEQVITDIHLANENDVDIAIESSKKAFENPEWRDMHPTSRAALMFRVADHL